MTGGVGLSAEVLGRIRRIEETAQDRLHITTGQVVHGASDTFRRWGRGIAMFMAAEEAARDLVGRLAAQHTAELERNNTDRPSAILQVMGRGCLTAWEVRSNITLGLSHAAHILSRTAYELMVVGAFLAKHDNETAKRFLSHHVVQLEKYARTWKEANDGDPTPLDAEGVDALHKEYEELIETNGRAYRADYGWAAASLGKDVNDRNTRVQLRELEEDVDLNYRPQYHLLSVHSHPTPLGTRLVHRRNEAERVDTLQIGPSPDGSLAEPAVTCVEFLLVLLQRGAPAVAESLSSPPDGIEHDVRALQVVARKTQQVFREVEASFQPEHRPPMS